MATTITQLKIFVGSPNDVNEERAIVKKVVDEFNITSPKLFGIYLDLIGWEKHVYPSIGEDPQDVINKQIADDYDIYLGIMWARFGTPTKRDESGTKEEFERAYKKYLKAPESIYVLFYFKKTPKPIDDIDIEQLSQVKDFQKYIGETKGTLHKEFYSADEFEQLLRINLTSIIGQYSKTNKDFTLKEKTQKAVNNEDVEEDVENEIGLFEHQDLATEKLQVTTNIISKIADYIDDTTSVMEKANAELKATKNKPQALQEPESRRIIDAFSVELLNYSKRIDVEIPILSKAFSEAINHYNKAFTIIKQFNMDSDDSETQLILEQLTSTKISITSAAESVNTFNQEIQMWPSVTSKLIKAKSRLKKTLNSLYTELMANVNLIDQLKDALQS